jgi:ACS family glucarate transporter-like MFS transporter
MVTYGWRWSFWVSACLGLLAGIVWMVIVRDTPEEHPWVTPGEVAYIKAGALRPGGTARAAALPWRAIIANPQVAIVTFSYFCYGYVAYIFFTWFFTYLNTVRGLNLKASAFYATLPFLAMAAGSSLGGIAGDWLSHRVGRYAGRCGVGAVGMFFASVFVVLATQVQDARLASVVLAGGAGALYLSQSAFWSVSADIGGTSAGSVSGVMNMGNQIAGTITASLTPWLAERFGWTPSFVVAGVICLAGAAAWLFVRPERH